MFLFPILFDHLDHVIALMDVYSVTIATYIVNWFIVVYRIRQNIRGGKLSRFSRILAKRESFTIESFPASSQLKNNYS